MMILMHYTTSKYVYDIFGESRYFTKQERINEIQRFYDNYKRNQENLFFIVSYTAESVVNYQVGKIIKVDDGFTFNKLSKNNSNIIIQELGILDRNTYDKDFYYKEFWIEEKLELRNKILNEYLSKIRLKYFTWGELLAENDILFEKISNILFDINNVLELATFYNTDLEYTEEIRKKKYYSALKNLGFIKKDSININHSVLHGDIGEFLMHALVSKFMDSTEENYIYPKLVFKTSPSMSVYGNDGSIYNPEKKIIYYLEAKFYSDLKEAVDEAVKSLSKHNENTQEDLNYSAELFRSIKTNRTNEIVEISNDVTEKLIVFLICGDIYEQTDIMKKIESHKKLKVLKERFEVIVFVLPILDKEEFLKNFSEKSKVIGGQYYAQ